MESSTFKHRPQPDFSSISAQRQFRKTPIHTSCQRANSHWICTGFSIRSHWILNRFSMNSYTILNNVSPYTLCRACWEFGKNSERIYWESNENILRIQWEFMENLQFDILGWYLFCVRIRRGRRATGVLTVLPLWHGLSVGRPGVFRVPVPVLCFSFGFWFWAVC